MASRPISSISTTFGVAAVTVGATVPAVGCRRVRLEATADCYVTISNPVLPASSANGLLLRTPTYGQEFGVIAGDSISVIQASAGGTLNVTFMGDA